MNIIKYIYMCLYYVYIRKKKHDRVERKKTYLNSPTNITNSFPVVISHSFHLPGIRLSTAASAHEAGKGQAKWLLQLLVISTRKSFANYGLNRFIGKLMGL